MALKLSTEYFFMDYHRENGLKIPKDADIFCTTDYGGHATHARFMKIGGVEDGTGGRVMHLSQQEEQVIIKTLVEQRKWQEQAMSQTKQFLRRMTGSIIEYVNTVGMRPLRLSNFDKARGRFLLVLLKRQSAKRCI